MSTISFTIKKQQIIIGKDNVAYDIEVLDRGFDPSNITVIKNGSAVDNTVVNNGDGSYQILNISSSDAYGILLNGSEQDEFKNIYFAVEDTLKQTDVDDTTIEFSGGQLGVVNGSTLVYESDVVTGLTSSSSIAPGAADNDRLLDAKILQKEDADATILKEADLNTDISTGGSTKGVSAEALKDADATNLKEADLNTDISTGGSTKGVSADALKTALDQNYSSEVFINDSKTIPQNIERLENALVALDAPDSIFSYRTLWSETLNTNWTNSDATGSLSTYNE